ncbi:MAG: hypothetical protein JXD18_08180, partial [Anaerolineae bacterium]|nr:hypothetical protein [Anaerolineae bacterium]
MRNNSVRAVTAAMSMLVLAALACGPAGSSTTEVTEPSITITGPASGTQVMVGDDVQVVSTSVADAGVSRVELSVNGQMVRSDAPPSGNPTTFSVAQPWTPMAEGEVTISAVVYDVDGTASEPAVIVLQVEAAVAEVTSTPVPDEEGEGGCTLNAAYEADVTVPDDTEMEPGESFIKTWRIRNTGTCDWGAGFALVFVDRDQMGAPSSVPIDPTAAGETVDVAVTMVAPESPGTYRSDWRVRSDTGTTFGSIVYVRIVVPEEATATPTPTLTPTTGPTSESLVPPTNLEATFSGGHVHFTWDDAQGETAYRYEISFAAGGLGAATTGSLPADTESYDGGSVSCGGDGGFTIIAIAEGGAEIGRDSVTYETDPCPEETITIPYANRGQVDADGGTAAPSNAGDTNANNGLQGFVTFD